MLDADTQTMFDVSNYLMWANMSELNLILDLTEDDLRYISATNSSDVWADYLANQEEVSLSSFDFLNQVSEFINVIEGADWRSQPYFNKYFSGDAFPKFIFYSAHEETLYPFLNAFEYFMIEKVYPGSALFIEFFETEFEDRVRLLYKKDADTEDVVLKYLAQGDNSISLNEFKQFVNHKIKSWNLSSDTCEVFYDDSEVHYWGADIWKQAYVKHFGLESNNFLK